MTFNLLSRTSKSFAIIDPLEPRRFSSATYYVSPTGNDANGGTTIAHPWKTLARVAKTNYHAGDSILLKGGATFPGTLNLNASDIGTASAPIKISSYGTGTPIVTAGNGNGIYLLDSSGISISNLKLVGSSTSYNTSCGVSIFSDETGKPLLGNITIDHVDVSQFGFNGIGIGAKYLTHSYDNIRVTNSTLYDNADAGLFAYAGNFHANPAPYGMTFSNIYIGHVIAHDNPGFAGTNDSGNGIMLGCVNGAVIERCTAYDNGKKNVSKGGGPVGIWCYNSNNVTIQYNESYANTSTYIDGDGFDFDGGVTNSVMQYNYSHDNTGSGILLCQFANATAFSGNVVRYNISQNDGRTNNAPAIRIWAPNATTTVTNTSIYNNTVYLTKPKSGSTAALQIDQYTKNVRIFNNAFDVQSGVKTLLIKNTGSGLVLDGNDYWTGSASATNIQWGSTNYATVAAFSKTTKQELLKSTLVGRDVDPQFTKAGGGQTFSSADSLSQLSAYVLKSTSSLINAGVSLTAQGLNPGSTNFYAVPLSKVASPNIGAY